MKKSANPRQFALIFSIVGALIVASGIGGLIKSHASSSWPTTQGSITASGVRTFRDSSRKTLHSPEVRYEYTVDGQRHVSSRVSFGDASTSSSLAAEKVAARYPTGSAVTVYYSPKDPGSSVLEAGITGANYFLPLMGLGFFGAGLWLFRNGPKRFQT